MAMAQADVRVDSVVAVGVCGFHHCPVFLDGEGTKLATSDGPQGNLGCPWTDEEIETFGKIVAKVVRNLTAEDLAKLKRTMVEQRKKAEAKS